MPEEAQPPTTPSAGDPRGKIGRTTTIEPMAPGVGFLGGSAWTHAPLRGRTLWPTPGPRLGPLGHPGCYLQPSGI